MFKAFTIDPGRTTGAAIWQYTDTGIYKLEQVDEYPERNGLYSVIENTKFDIIIYEAFRLYANKAKAQIGSDFEAAQIIGVIKYLAEKQKTPAIEQMASIKTFWTNDRLKKMGLYVTSDHRRDSIRHFLHWYYLVAKYGNKRDLL